MTRPDDPAKPMYVVYLRETDIPGVEISSPVETDRLEFYDTGIWAAREDGGRDFFPWERVALIREVTATSTEDDEATDTPVTEEEQGPVV